MSGYSPSWLQAQPGCSRKSHLCPGMAVNALTLLLHAMKLLEQSMCTHCLQLLHTQLLEKRAAF